jgi:hypothetical protein
MCFRFESVPLSVDEETGKKTTAPVLISADAPTDAANKKSRRLSKGAEIALRALKEAVEELGTVPPASNHIPPKAKVVTMKQWRDYAARRGICSSDSEDVKVRVGR